MENYKNVVILHERRIKRKKLFAPIKEKPANYGQCCGSKAYAGLRAEILAATPKLLPDEFDFKTRIFQILHGITDFPKCSVCGKPTKSEVENMKDNGSYQIFGCGNFVFKKDYA